MMNRMMIIMMMMVMMMVMMTMMMTMMRLTAGARLSCMGWCKKSTRRTAPSDREQKFSLVMMMNDGDHYDDNTGNDGNTGNDDQYARI